ncbi:MAG TPA: GAF domain-containing protein, partial [Planctomycetota bacterium]|nr:GAF domain-containing protein [Planctomycetota bacterium]
MSSPLDAASPGPWRVLAVGPAAAGARAAFDQARELIPADVRFVENGEEALDRLQAGAVDVLLLDAAAAFPTLLERLRERAPGVPILLLGADGDRSAAESALRWGADEVLSGDDLDPMRLARAVRAAGERARLRRSLRERGDRAHALQTVLLELAKSELADEEQAVRRLLRASARTLGVERVGLWVFNEDRSEIVCRALYRLSADAVESGAVLRARDYPRYFAALEESRVLPAHDAVADPRTSEYSAGYLRPLGITSMMDVPVRVQGRLTGMICHEHVGPPREWTLDEQAFASSLADLAALALEASERRRAEGALREERNFMAALLESTSSMVAALDAEGRLVRANRAFFHALGWPPAEALGRPFLELALSPEDADAVRPVFAAPPASEVGTAFEHAWVRRDGARPRVAWALTVVRGADGAVRNFVVSGTDVTERTAL